MRRLITCLAACAVALAAAGAATAKHGGVMCALNATLRAANETPPTTSTAKGHTLVKVWNDGTIEFRTQILNPDNETFVMAHIHRAPKGVPGPVVVPLFNGSTSATHIRQSGTATPLAGSGVTGAALCQNPSAYYVNYHTTVFLGGAIRGQLH